VNEYTPAVKLAAVPRLPTPTLRLPYVDVNTL
jgi:hypothetical protein